MAQRYNTGNARPSNSMKDLNDNALANDDYMNSEADTFIDRLGDERDTLRGSTKKMLAAGAAAVKEAQDSITILGLPFTTREEAQAAADDGKIPVGAVTWARNVGDASLADELINNGGTLEATGRRMPSQEFVEAVNAQVSALASNFFQSIAGDAVMLDVVDDDWFSFFRVLSSGAFGAINCLLSPDGVHVRDLTITHDGETPGLTYQDPDGFFVRLIGPDGKVAPNSLSGDGKFTTEAGDFGWLTIQDDEGFYRILADANGEPTGAGNGGGNVDDGFNLTAADAQNKAYSQSVSLRYNAEVQRLVSGLNHLIIYSQSLGTQQEGWPALSKTPVEGYDNLMLGDSIRPTSRTNPEFIPLGGATLKPLRAVVQSGDGSTLLTDAQVAVLNQGAGNEGEGGVAIANGLRRLWLQRYGLERDQSRRFVLSSTGVNGRSIEQLSKGAVPELYQRPLQAVQQVKAAADQLGVSYSLGAIIWIQGEWNYTKTNGSNDKALYKANLEKLYNDMVTDMAVGIAGQKSPPAIFLYQTGDIFTRDDEYLSIGMAQWEFCQEHENAYLVTPAYPFPDKGGHLGPNGYRWMDMQFAKVMHRVLNQGEGWEPLGPIKIIIIGRVVYVFYHVPAPPLKFRPTYKRNVATMYDDRGFRVTDNAGTVAITGVEIVADTIIKITLTRELVAGARLWYGDLTTHNGNGNVFDSDSFNSLDNFVYQAGTGQYDSENIPELVGKPYPLNNASVQFCLSIPYGE
ncbi:TPA: sialate O-acetylesterase [Escherichia coli]